MKHFQTDMETGEITEVSVLKKPWSAYDAEIRPRTYEANFEHSMTVPDQAMTIREIMERHTMGLPIPGNTREPEYFEDELPDLEKLDLTELAELAHDNATILKEIEDEQQKIEDAKQRKITENEIRKKILDEQTLATNSQNILENPAGGTDKKTNRSKDTKNLRSGADE